MEELQALAQAGNLYCTAREGSRSSGKQRVEHESVVSLWEVTMAMESGSKEVIISI